MSATADFAPSFGDELITPAEAAVMLHLAPSTVRRGCAKGEIPGALPKLGGRNGVWRINKRILLEYLASAAPPPGRDAPVVNEHAHSAKSAQFDVR